MNQDQVILLLRQRRQRRAKSKGGASTAAMRLGGGVLLIALLSVVGTVLAAVGTVAGVYSFYAQDLPDPNEIVTRQEKFETTKIYDRSGQVLLMEVIDPRRGDRTLLPLEQIPEDFRNATIALEDKTFYQNLGIDPVGIARAFLLNLQGQGVQGGSSITVQLVKNILIPEEERYEISYARKIKEAILALEISRLYSKDQILEWYLNTNYYGNWAIGVEAAAQVYFGKHAQELSLAECAMLAPIVQYPAMNPIDNPDQAKKRQEIALTRLVEEGYISNAEADAALAETVVDPHFALLKRYDIVAPHFAVYVRKQLEDQFGPTLLYQGGLKVYTTVDLEINRIAEEEARAQVARLQEEKKDVTNAAVVVLRAQTGEILAMVGSIDYWNEEIDGNVNVAVAPRQPGSSFKPFSYVTAFHQGHTAAELVMDVRTCFDDYPNPPYCPEDYDREYLGPRSYRTALAQSRNIPAVKVLDIVGVGNVIRTAHAMGINTLNEDLDYYGLSLTLGGGEVWLLDLAYAYGVFANGGTMTGQPAKLLRPGYRPLDPVSILRVEDAKGAVLWQYTRPEARSVTLADGRELSAQEAFLLTNVLADNNARAPVFGSSSALRLSRPAAAKTGTTTDWRDVWTVGYTPQIVTGVWVGNNDNTPMEGVSSARGAGPIWHNVMERVYNEGHAARLLGEVVENFPRPAGLAQVEVCALSGLLPTEHCPRTKALFIEGTEPTEYCNVHRVERVNRETGKLATACTPPELVEERVYEIYPPEAADWVRDQGIAQPPTQRDEIYGCSPEGEEVVILDPTLGGHVKQVVAVRGNARAGDFGFYRLEFGEGLNPSSWSQMGGDHYNQVENDVLEFWDVRGLRDGLYTLQLSVVENSGNVRRATIYVTVDNEAPAAAVGYPWPGRVYQLETDEWANLTADVSDNVQIDKVEFYLDDTLLDFSVVEPYGVKWVLEMRDRIPNPRMEPVYETRPITNPDGTLGTEVVTVTWVTVSEDRKTITQTWENGAMVISSSHGYTESHVVHVIAFDAAGNETESEKVRFYIMHKPKEEKEEKEEEAANGLGEGVAVGGFGERVAVNGFRERIERMGSFRYVMRLGGPWPGLLPGGPSPPGGVAGRG